MLLLGTLSLGLWVIAVDPAFIAGQQSIKNCGIWIDQLDQFPAVMTKSFFLIFSEDICNKLCVNLPHLQFPTNDCVYSSHIDINCAHIVSINKRRFLFMKFFIWPSTLVFWLPYSSQTSHHPSQTTAFLESLMPLENWCSIHARCSKSSLKHPIRFCGIFSKFKTEFIAYRSSKVSSRPDCIFEIHQLWQSGFSRVYSNCCCSCSFEPEIIKIGQSSHKIYSNNILNFQESTTILHACTKKSGNLSKAPRNTTWNHFNLCKQMINCKQKYLFSIEMLKTIELNTTEWAWARVKMYPQNKLTNHIYLIYSYQNGTWH